MTDEQSSGAADLQECPDCGGPQVPWSGGRCIGCEVRRTSLADARTLSRLHEAFVHALAQKGIREAFDPRDLAQGFVWSTVRIVSFERAVADFEESPGSGRRKAIAFFTNYIKELAANVADVAEQSGIPREHVVEALQSAAAGIDQDVADRRG